MLFGLIKLVEPILFKKGMSRNIKLGNKVGVCGESFFYEGNEVA